MGNEYPSYNSNYISGPVIQNQFKPMIITTTKVDYFKGEYVEGNITLNNQLPIVLSDIYLNLYLLESWIYQETSSQSYGEMNKQPLLCVQVGINKILKVDTELVNLSAGYFNFPFKFQLPNYLQPCFEYPLPEKRSYLRYSLESKFISPYVQGSTSTYIIIKSRPSVLNSPLSFSSVMNVHKWGLIDQGTTQLKVSYLTNNFRINDNANLKVEINNTRGKLKVSNCEINVVRKVGYRKKQADNNQYLMENIIVNKNYDVNVEPMNQKTYNYTIELIDKDKNIFNYLNVQNPYPNLIDISYAMPTVDGTIIKCDYSINVILHFDSFVTNGYLPKVTLPISLTHQTQDEYNLEKQEDEDLQRAIEASKIEMDNQNYKNEFDLIDEENNKNENKNNYKNINMSVVDKNKMNDLIDKPNGYDMEKFQPISQSQLIDNDNNNLPSKNEIENNNKNKIKNNDNNKNYQNMNIMNNYNGNINQNNFRNNIFMNPNNYENINAINNNLQNCPAPAWINKKDNEDDLFNPYMKNSISNNNNCNNNNQINNAVNINFSNYNNFNNPLNQNNNNIRQINQINNNNLNIINNYQNFNNRENENRNNNQVNNEMNNNYPDINNYPKINDDDNKTNIIENNNNPYNKNNNEDFKTISGGDDFNLLKENNDENLNNEREENKEDNKKYFNINEI